MAAVSLPSIVLGRQIRKVGVFLLNTYFWHLELDGGGEVIAIVTSLHPLTMPMGGGKR